MFWVSFRFLQFKFTIHVLVMTWPLWLWLLYVKTLFSAPFVAHSILCVCFFFCFGQTALIIIVCIIGLFAYVVQCRRRLFNIKHQFWWLLLHALLHALRPGTGHHHLQQQQQPYLVFYGLIKHLLLVGFEFFHHIFLISSSSGGGFVCHTTHFHI